MNDKLYLLWKLLDDIDTAGDIAKDNDKLYRHFVEEIQKKRWNVLSEEEVAKLYSERNV